MPYLSQNCSHAVLNDGTLTCTLRVLVHAHQNLSSLHASYMLFAQSMAVNERGLLAVGGELVYLFTRQHEGVPFLNSKPLAVIERPENEQGIFARHMELSNNHLLVSTGAGDAVYVMNITSCMGLEPRVAAPP